MRIIPAAEKGSSSSATPVEIRRYEAFTVARRSMEGDDIFGGASDGGAGFNALAAYLFGENGDSKAMAMTTPVAIESTAGSGSSSMSFVIPSADAEVPPAPLTDDVSLEVVPERLVAVRAFAGLVTDGEVERQRAALAAAIAADGSVQPVSADEYSVLQYNGPFTLLFRRRNELAVVVEDLLSAANAEEQLTEAVSEEAVAEEAAEAAAEAAEEAAEEVAEVATDGVQSWYDSGKRM